MSALHGYLYVTPGAVKQPLANFESTGADVAALHASQAIRLSLSAKPLWTIVCAFSRFPVCFIDMIIFH